MKYVPSRIEVVVEPHVWSTQKEIDALSLKMTVRVNNRVISSQEIKPLDFFLSHFDLVVQSASRRIKDELNKVNTADLNHGG